MKIFAMGLNAHDHNTYDGKTHIQFERFTRKKKNQYAGVWDEFYYNEFLPRFNTADSAEVFAWSYTNGALANLTKIKPADAFTKHTQYIRKYNDNLNHLWDYYQTDNFYYINHHQSHAAYAFLCSQYKESDILAIDGGGVGYRAVFFDKHGNMTDLSSELSLGWLWNLCCLQLNLNTIDSGKLMGLVGYGEFKNSIYNKLELFIDEMLTHGKFYHKDPPYNILANEKREDVACTLQQYTIDKIREHVYPLKTCDNLCAAGGVIYNGYLNQKLTENWSNVFIPPAVGDEGQALGNYMHADYVLNNNISIPSVYCGKEYNLKDDDIDYKRVAQAIADGQIIGWFQGKSESGNRALGNRSILADPRNPDIKDIINSRIKKREDWRPFAPSVLEEYYQDYFDTQTPSPYMSRIVNVISDKIPGVTHVDKTARIQTVNVDQNEKFYKLIYAFYEITGIPMLLNTSFNCQEPIVETPEDAIKTFNKTELDMLVLGSEIVTK